MNSQEQPSVIHRFDLSSACSRGWKDGASYTFNTRTETQYSASQMLNVPEMFLFVLGEHNVFL